MRTAIGYRRQQGSFIIESLVSVLLFAIGLVVLVGLSAQALNSIGQSRARNDASYLAGELVGQIWVSSSVDLTAWNARIAATLPNGAASVYTATCDCANASGTACNSLTPVTSATNWAPATAYADPSRGSQTQVTICITWSDKKTQSSSGSTTVESAVTHTYSTTAQVAKNL